MQRQMVSQKLFDDKGSPIFLDKELGRGGEGCVFSLQNHFGIVAKLYNKIPDQQKAEKIATMISIGTERLRRLAAWPINTVHTSTNELVGFTMPKLTNHKPLYELYNPKIRLKKFPNADWRFFIYAAINTARAFSVMHEAGHVIGDINHGNLYVAGDATVQFIDTDSFQIYFKDKYWLCDVGVSTHQPPEMQNKSSYKGIIRTPNHDNFGLAILIFQLLCLGRHPFSGTYLGLDDMSIEKAILEYQYAYSSHTNFKKLKPPPATLPMGALTPNLRSNFERAFSKEGTKLGFRPTPQDWAIALLELSAKLQQCTNSQSHYFFQEFKKCPWCDIEELCKEPFFPIKRFYSSHETDITDIWQQFLSISLIPLPTIPNLSNLQLAPSAEAVRIEKKIKLHSLVLKVFFITIVFSAIVGDLDPLIFFIGFCILISLFIFHHLRQKKLTRPISEKIGLLKPAWESAYLQHETLSKNSFHDFIIKQINDLKQRHDNIGKERDTRLQNLLQNRFQQQLKQYLNNYRIDQATIEGFGQGRITILQSHSIKTAADIELTKLIDIDGFGHVLISRLLEWRKMCESRFVFDSKKGVSADEVAILDQEINNIRKTIKGELSLKVSQLSQLIKEMNLSRQKLQDQISEIFPKYAQALSDAKTVGL